MAKPKIAICLPTCDQCHTDFALSLTLMYADSLKAQVASHILIYNRKDAILQQSRHVLADWALKDGCEWLLWLDSDMVFPPDTLLRLLRHQKSFVAAVTLSRHPPFHVTCARTFQGDIVEHRAPPRDKCIEVDWIGFACNLIHRDVFLSLQKPYFSVEWRKWSDGTEAFMGEDYLFCERARAAGHRIYVDGGLSHEIKHLGVVAHYIAEPGQQGSSIKTAA